MIPQGNEKHSEIVLDINEWISQLITEGMNE